MAILNPELYAVLVQAFEGDVQVVNEGCEGDVSYVRHNGKYYARVEGMSQQFRVNCPICGDRRGRLYINYLAVSNIKHKGEFVRTYNLMHCHNENCRTVPFYENLRTLLRNPPDLDVALSEYVPKSVVDVADLPKPSFLINSKKAHPAPRAYLQGRGYDLDEMAEVFGVRTCAAVPDVEHLGQMSLFPCYDGEMLTFWQARMSYDLPKGSKAPKYFFPAGGHKTRVLYNRFNALAQPLVVITEGVLDTIRVGEAGVAVFGKHPSEYQTKIMRHVFSTKAGVLMLDSDAGEEALRWYDKAVADKVFGKGLVLCLLPEGRDPGDHTREELWTLISNCVGTGGDAEELRTELESGDAPKSDPRDPGYCLGFL